MINVNNLAVNATNIIRGTQFFNKKSRNHYKILGARRVINEGSSILEKPQILGPAVQNLDARMNGCPGFVRSCYYLILMNPDFYPQNANINFFSIKRGGALGNGDFVISVK